MLYNPVWSQNHRDLLPEHLQGWDYKPIRPFELHLVFLCFVEDLAKIFIIDISLHFLMVSLLGFGIKVMLNNTGLCEWV